jgi:hypothetical protein
MSACAAVEKATIPTKKLDAVGNPKANANPIVASAQYFMASLPATSGCGDGNMARRSDAIPDCLKKKLPVTSWTDWFVEGQAPETDGYS